MRGQHERTGPQFPYISSEDRIPASHPLRQVADHCARSNLKLGWLGAEGHWNTVERIKHLLRHTAARSDLHPLTISNHPQADITWLSDHVRHDLMTCDIGIVPVDLSNPASLAKSTNRVNAFQAIGLLAVCTRIKAYEASIVHGVTGFFADTEEDWIHV